MTTPIQEQPESTVGRKPDRVSHPERPQKRPAPRDVSQRGEEGDEGKSGRSTHERERGEGKIDD